MTETATQQRERILNASPDTAPSMYDSAVKLGYQPESYDGMWKLPVGYPIVWLSKRWALVTEVVCKPGTHVAVFTARGEQKTRRVLRRASANS